MRVTWAQRRRWTQPRSGAERGDLLAYLLTSQPGCAWVAERAGTMTGFVLGRTGRLTLHLGPLIARDHGIAIALAANALAGDSGAPVSIDVPDDQTDFRAPLVAAGFAPVRPFTRMLRAKPGVARPPGTTYAIAGPELG